MDFTPELSAFQGVISSADEVCCVSRLTCRGGNEENIKYFIDNVKKFFNDVHYLNESGVIDTMTAKARKFALYIVLNTDFKVLETMVELEGIFLVIWSIPTLPKHLMCEMIWSLQMDDFICEIITYCYPPLGFEVASAFADHFKYFDALNCLQKLQKFTAACYSLICRLHCFELDKENCNNILVIGFDTLQKWLKYFTNPPNSSKLAQIRKDELYKFKGERLKTILLLISECFNHFTQEVNSNYFSDIYKSTYKEDCFKKNPPTNKVCEYPDETVQDHLYNCNILLLDVFKEIVMDVSVDIFCAWSEFEADGRSMQQTIGELCHKVRTKLLNVSSVCEHPVVGMIQQMARKPVVIKDIINSTDTSVIIQNITSNNEDRPSWLHALVHKEELCQDIKLINIIGSNLDIFNQEECFKLYHIFTNYAKSNTNNRELVRSLAVKVFQYCTVTDKHKLLQQHFIEDQFLDLSDGEEFQNTLTEMFNKFVTASDVDFTEVLNVFLQNPRQVYNKIFILAKENPQLTNIMLRIMELLKDYSNFYYVTETEPCLIKTIKTTLDQSLDTDTKQDNLIRFLYGLKSGKIISGTTLLLLIIMPNIHKALLSKDIGKINIQIQLLDKAFTINELLEYRAPMLAMLSQVLEVVRWQNIKTFVPNAPSTLQLTLDFQKSLIDTYDNVIPDDEGNWLRLRLKQMNMQPMNNYYFRKLWGSPSSNFFQAISCMLLNRDSNLSEISVVTQILSSGTQEEWCVVWDDLARHIEDIDVLCIFHETIRMINKVVEATRTPSTRACLFYCIQNLVYIIRYKFIQEPLTVRHVVSVAFSLSKVLREINKDVDEIGSILMPLFAYLVEKRNLYTIDIPSYFKNTNYFTLICRAFNGTSDQNDVNH